MFGWVRRQWYLIRELIKGEVELGIPAKHKQIEEPKSWLFNHILFWREEPPQMQALAMFCIALMFILLLFVNILVNKNPDTFLGNSVYIP
jgi:hypothetical protein